MKETDETEESISVEEILDLALRYIDESECGVIARPNELFALFVRPIASAGKTAGDWIFVCYGLVLDYFVNLEKPRGKWITLKYISFDSFPPKPSSIRLQPPHIAKGYFQNFDRTSEMKIVAVFSHNANEIKEESNEGEAQILQFPVLDS